MARQADLFAGGVEELPSPAVAGRAAACSDMGVETLDEAATLTQLLRRCGPSCGDPQRAAEALLAQFGGIGRVLGAPVPDLARVVGDVVAAEIALLHALLLRALEHPLRSRTLLTSWDAAKTYVRARLRALPREAFHVLFLDVRNQLIADERMGEGSISHAPVYPREVVRRALELSANALLLAHNHPTGDPTPSKADIEMTLQIVAAAKPLGIAVHDHLVVGGDQVTSLKGLGLM